MRDAYNPGQVVPASRPFVLCAVALAASATATSLAATPHATIRYTFSDRYDLDIWTGPTAHPIQAYGGNGGTIDVSVTRNTNGTYGVRQTVRDVGGAGSLDSTYALVRQGSQLLEVLERQTGAFRSVGEVRRDADTYPNGRVAFALPLSPNDAWSAATRDRSTLSIVTTSPSPYSLEETADSAGNGTYAAQVAASDFTSSTDVELDAASTYRLSKQGYNALTQTFALPSNGVIDVTSSGTPPLPVKPGTVKMKSWYPYNHGALTRPLVRDRFRVVGPTKIPSLCKHRVNQNAIRVDEDGYTVDPVRGTASAFSTAYLLTRSSDGTQLVACVAEQYVNAEWANAWALGLGNWGKLVRLQSGGRLFIADASTPDTAGAERIGLPVIGLDAIAMRRILALDALPYPPPGDR